MEAEPQIAVEIAYALPAEQVVIELHVPLGVTVKEVILRSGLQARFPEITGAILGIYGKEVGPDTRVADGDRVEIYRALLADPKHTRRSRAQGR